METVLLPAFLDAYDDLYQPSLIIAGCFVFVSLVLSILLIFEHLRSYNNPPEQKWIVAVLIMVPTYAIESILSLWNPSLSLACDILRSCYEAFALYSFGRYLIACLGGERSVIELLENESREHLNSPLLEGENQQPKSEQRAFRHFFFQPSLLGRDLLKIEKFGLVQYMILKTLSAFAALILEIFGVYGDGKFNWSYGYPYIAVVINFSQMWALFCLVQFYNVTHDRLKPIKPLAKFISFKAIVFATWWQGVGIALLCSLGVLPKEGRMQSGLQDFLICIEMFIAAVAHVMVFPAKPYHRSPPTEYGKFTAQRSMKVEGKNKEKPVVVEKVEAEVEGHGTSVKESIQDIVVEGGQHVVKDVALTLNQAIGPLEKGVTKIQDTFHEISASDQEVKEEQQVEVEVDQHLERSLSSTATGSGVFNYEENIDAAGGGTSEKGA